MSCICKLLLSCCSKQPDPVANEPKEPVNEQLYTLVQKVEGRGSVIIVGLFDEEETNSCIRNQRPLPALPLTESQKQRKLGHSAPPKLEPFPEAIISPPLLLERSPAEPVSQNSPSLNENRQLTACEPQLTPPTPRLEGRAGEREHMFRLPDLLYSMPRSKTFSMREASAKRNSCLKNFYQHTGRRYTPEEHLTSTNTIFRTLVLEAHKPPEKTDSASDSASK